MKFWISKRESKDYQKSSLENENILYFTKARDIVNQNVIPFGSLSLKACSLVLLTKNL